jgi:hypothetical protein
MALLTPEQMLGKVLVGNDAGWALTFSPAVVPEELAKPRTLSREDCYAEIDATLPAGLEGGSYTFTIEGLTDEQHSELQALAPSRHGQGGLIDLHLYWRDVNASVVGYLSNLAGLTDLVGRPSGDALREVRVARLVVTKVARRVGQRRYETVVSAVERVFSPLTERVVRPLGEPSVQRAVEEIANRTGIDIELHPPGLHGLEEDQGPRPGSQQTAQPANLTYVQALKKLAARTEYASGKYGRGLFLIRDGVLHFGARPIPFDGGQPRRLSLGDGLLHVEREAPVQRDPAAKDEGKGEGDGATAVVGAGRRVGATLREQFKLTLKGRPDIKPGDVVAFKRPPEDAPTRPGLGRALLGGFGGAVLSSLEGEEPDTTGYVNGVQHKLGRTSGFATFLTVVQLEEGDDGWDRREPVGGARPAPEDSGAAGASPNAYVNAANAIQQLVQRALQAIHLPEVGEVRAATTTGKGAVEPPAQTTTVWSGLVPSDGRMHEARRLPVERRNHHQLDGVAYATPFAWGRCGLVLPRYPGTRVVLVHRHGNSEDPVEVGAVWESGHGPDSKLGDWWLILPAEVAEAARSRIKDTETPADPTGKATNDLIDADGNRVIEVGRLTVRVGKDGLHSAGQRPAPGRAADFVAIEHADGVTRLLVRQDGTIEVHAKKNLELTAGGDINLKATSVNVQVDDAMKVT